MRGGCKTRLPGSRGSSYASELVGVVEVLRWIETWTEWKQIPPGRIHHWADNKGVIQGLNHIQAAGRVRGRLRPCRNLWAEIKIRLARWKSRGGEWKSTWVRGHADERAGHPKQLTQAEQMNVWADKCAEQAMVAGAQPAQYAQPEWVRRMIAGGTWWIGRGSPQESIWHDSVTSVFNQYDKQRNIQEYWARRRNNAGRTGRVSPAWDSRVGSGIAGGAVARKKIDFFRTRLWWDHLPTPTTLARGSSGGTIECEWCATGASGSAWHLLGECRNPLLQQARIKASDEMELLLEELESTSYREIPSHWRRAFEIVLLADGTATWARPLDWPAAEELKAGEAAIPWYGLFPPNWLDGWMRADGDGLHAPGVKAWNQGKTMLTKIGKVAITCCQTIWQEVTAIWRDRERKRNEEERVRAAIQTNRLAAERKRQARVAEDQAFMADPLRRATTLKAEQVLEEERRRWLQRGARRLSAEATFILRWRKKTKQQIYRWWMSRAARKRRKTGLPEDKERKRESVVRVSNRAASSGHVGTKRKTEGVTPIGRGKRQKTLEQMWAGGRLAQTHRRDETRTAAGKGSRAGADPPDGD